MKRVFSPGQVFVVPLLRGGFAFGYIVAALREGWLMVDIVDAVSDTDEVPVDIDALSIAIKDRLISPARFKPHRWRWQGEPWRLTKVKVSRSVQVVQRYLSMGGEIRVDVLGIERDKRVSREEAARYPKLSIAFPPYDTALVEVTVRRLGTTPLQLCQEWERTLPEKDRPPPSALAENERSTRQASAAPLDPAFAPCMLVDGENPSLIWNANEFAPYIPLFARQKLEGNGYSWQALIEAELKQSDPSMLRSLVFDSEAGMFCVRSRDRTKLKKVAALIRSLTSTSKALAAAIKKHGSRLVS